MKHESNVLESEVKRAYYQLMKDAVASGYHLNPDESVARELVRSLCINKQRYGYQACPCRLASGSKHNDLDIICPCDYRDADLEQYGTCYCGLYVSDDVVNKDKKIMSIPERRQVQEMQQPMIDGQESEKNVFQAKRDVIVWRCRVCGYLCARNQPPQRCPICKATKERFERFSCTV
jgi:ferredoxin-thioredoxin reductase catalytic subunit